MSNVSLIDGHLDNAEHCVCCGQVIPEGRQHCIICGKKVNGKQRQIDRIRNMGVDELARWLAEHIDHYRAPYEVKEIYANAIDNKTGKGIIWIEAFKIWLEQEVEEWKM